MKIAIDSSVYLSSLFKEDVNHKDSFRFFQKIEKQVNITVVLPLTIALEVENVYYRQTAREFDFSETESLRVDWIYINNDFYHYIWKERPKASLKTSEMIILSLATAQKATFVSWDKQLLKEAKRHVKAMTPSGYLKDK